MNLFIAHIVSGNSFFSGIFLLILAICMSFYSKRGRLTVPAGITCRITAFVGIAFIVLSSTPVNLLLYIVMIILTILLMVLLFFRDKIKGKYLSILRIALILSCIISFSLEIPHHISPVLADNDYSKA